MKLDSNKTKNVNFRMNEEEYTMFKYIAFMSGHTPSSLCRFLMQQCVMECRKLISEGQITYEDIKKIVND